MNELPERVQHYISDIIKTVQGNQIELVSVILFGSLIKGGFSDDTSDVDIIIVIDNDVSNSDKNNISFELTKLEFKYGFRKETTSKIDYGYKFAERITGMFISHFICSENDFLRANFSQIFNVNRFLSYMLAPKDIVFASVISTAKTIWGEDLIPNVAIKPISSVQVIKSLFMNLILTMMSLLTFPFHHDATKFSMEALKWSLYTCYYCFEKKSTNLEEIIQFFRKNDLDDPLFQLLLQLRTNYTKSLFFVLNCVISIYKLHKKVLNETYYCKQDTTKGSETSKI